MISYVLKKLGYALLTLYGVVTVIFLLFYLLPGDPAQMMLGQNESEEQLANVRAKYGLDKSIGTQYLYFLNDLSPVSFHSLQPEDFTYDNGKYTGVALFKIGETSTYFKWPYLRESFQKTDKKVSYIIGETLPNTMILAVAAISIALVLGLILGVVSALYKNSWLDQLIQVISTMGMSVPSFFSAIIFAFVFGYAWHEWTGLKMSGSLYEMDDYGEGMQLQWRNLILPAVVLGIRPLAVISQLMRNSLLEVMGQEYITTAYAKGLTTLQVIKKHAFKNALNPVITAVSGWFASLLAGAVFVEYIFNWNGIGKEIVEALNTQDLPVITGAVLVIATLFILINILVDFIYVWLDPRVRLE
ncbi:peptide/nickel transport system permease protein [Nonlabens dokdonensis]|uniref:Peptide/nickel transport system permease protein n=2 Tax=Nonlabens dokdonensis TaxID=328515 RepID=A0ABX5PW11_9FLAO|nr:ABC transporter permease [Nonlabens dokdonensis]AGC75178.1 putative binding-protein-dependent transport system inner membrane component [Nonlabens dokdonensis DSW-6]PZX39078.1 peptide/nickel transport system permease protein [Nonlabens dokdonensis]